MVGYGRDRLGNADPQILIIHDSSDRSGTTFSNQYVRLEKLESGRLIKMPETDIQGYPRNAKGLYKLVGEMKIKQGADVGIMQGAIVLDL